MKGAIRVVVGIDPDVDKSGVAVLDVVSRALTLSCLPFSGVMAEFVRLKVEYGDALLAVVEAGWLNTTHWHIGRGDSKAMAAAKGNSVGRNHQTGRLIVEMAHYYGINVQERKPLHKIWRGADRKITAEEFAAVTGYDKRCNQEERDAGLLAWVTAGFPLRLKSKRS